MRLSVWFALLTALFLLQLASSGLAEKLIKAGLIPADEFQEAVKKAEEDDGSTIFDQDDDMMPETEEPSDEDDDDDDYDYTADDDLSKGKVNNESSTVDADEKPEEPPTEADEKPEEPPTEADEKPEEPPTEADEKPEEPPAEADEKPEEPPTEDAGAEDLSDLVEQASGMKSEGSTATEHLDIVVNESEPSTEKVVKAEELDTKTTGSTEAENSDITIDDPEPSKAKVTAPEPPKQKDKKVEGEDDEASNEKLESGEEFVFQKRDIEDLTKITSRAYSHIASAGILALAAALILGQ